MPVVHGRGPLPRRPPSSSVSARNPIDPRAGLHAPSRSEMRVELEDVVRRYDELKGGKPTRALVKLLEALVDRAEELYGWLRDHPFVDDPELLTADPREFVREGEQVVWAELYSEALVEDRRRFPPQYQRGAQGSQGFQGHPGVSVTEVSRTLAAQSALMGDTMAAFGETLASALSAAYGLPPATLRMNHGVVTWDDRHGGNSFNPRDIHDVLGLPADGAHPR